MSNNLLPQTRLHYLDRRECVALYDSQAVAGFANGTELPVNQALLETLQQSPLSVDPWWVDAQVQGQALTALLLVEPNLSYFSGHFPNNPLVPGVVQIHWAALAWERWLGALAPGGFVGLRQIKFKAPIGPGMLVRLVLKLEPGKIALTIDTPAHRHTQGHILYRG